MLLAAVLANGCGVGGEPIERAESPILAGTTDTTDTAIVAVDTMLPTGEELCSGYLFMPDLVLTARHCAAPVMNPSGPCATVGSTIMASGGAALDPSKLLVLPDGDILTSSHPLAVAEVTVLPGTDGQSLCGNDLAVLRLAAPLEGVTPLNLQIASAPTVGETVTAIGYGVSTPSDMGGTGIRRSRMGVTVATVGATLAGSLQRTVDGEWIADTGPCAGDSGSPTLDASGAAMGVMSRGPKATCTSMVYERIDTHAAFLIDQATASAKRLGVPLPVWAGGSAGTGGSGGSASSTSTTGSGSPKPTPPKTSSGGCSVSPHPSGGFALGAVALVLGGALAARRRRRGRTS